jgi:hypothetical protein
MFNSAVTSCNLYSPVLCRSRSFAALHSSERKTANQKRKTPQLAYTLPTPYTDFCRRFRRGEGMSPTATQPDSPKKIRKLHAAATIKVNRQRISYIP